jgi:hypothetical protein
VQDQENKFAHVGSIMTTFAKMRISSLVSTMLNPQRDELNMAKRRAYSCSHPNILRNGSKNVMNYILGPYAHIAIRPM